MQTNHIVATEAGPIGKLRPSRLVFVACIVALVLIGASVNAQKKVAKRTATKTTTQTATRLSGTYRLMPARSDDVRQAAELAAQNVADSERQRVLDDVLNRLETGDMLAIERRGRTINIVSSTAPRLSYVADGVARTRQLPDGSSARVRAILKGDQLTITYSNVRGNDSVTFDLIDAAGRLSVTRRVYGGTVTQPVIVQSLYERTSNVAQWDIYGSPETGVVPTATGQTTTSANTFIVPDGTSLTGVLNEDLSTKDSKERDRFTLTVREPSQYQGATIDGYISNLKRSGKITGRSEMTFNFERIRLANGKSYRFAGVVEGLRTSDEENVKVDTEGAVKEGESRTTTTEKRAAVGAVAGAIIGAIAGGGKGAAIGAIVGAGGGAGSVYIQGRDDLELKRGTEVRISASAPK